MFYVIELDTDAKIYQNKSWLIKTSSSMLKKHALATILRNYLALYFQDFRAMQQAFQTSYDLVYNADHVLIQIIIVIEYRPISDK